MRAYVFTDKALERYAGRFVWLAIDTENSANEAFLEKHPIGVWPTMLVIDPTQDSVVMRYVGGATVPQLTRLLRDAETLARGRGLASSDTLLVGADKLAGEKSWAEAAKLYQRALAHAPRGWSRLGRASEGYLFALSSVKDREACAARALERYPALRGSVSGANVAQMGLACATGIERSPARDEQISRLERAVRETLDDPRVPLSGDDRSGLFESLAGAREAVGDEAGRHALLEEWARFLEVQAAGAKTPEQRAVYDSHRLTVYLDLKQPEKAVPMLEQSERDLPRDYNPPARLALALLELKRYDEALAAADRGLARAYGPRKLSIYGRRADILIAQGRPAAARRTLQDAIAYARTLPGGDDLVKRVEAKLATIPE